MSVPEPAALATDVYARFLHAREAVRQAAKRCRPVRVRQMEERAGEEEDRGQAQEPYHDAASPAEGECRFGAANYRRWG